MKLPLSRQQWHHATFLHYPCEEAAIARLLPRGLQPQLFQGQAWVSITPLLMHRVRPAGVPPLPGWSTFPEVNFRTYVRAPGGHDGIWFFRMDCPRRLMVWGMNLLGLNYHHRPAEFSHSPGQVNYRFGGEREHSLTVDIGERITEQSERDVFLTGRWNTFAPRFRTSFRFPICHDPWPLYTAAATGSMLAAAPDVGLPRPDTPPVIHYSPAVDVHIAAPRPASW